MNMNDPFVWKRPADGGPQLFELARWTEEFPGLTAGITSRHGGVSSAEWSSLNCALHIHDNPDDVIHNREQVARALGFSFERWTCAEQVHGNEVQQVTIQEAGRGNRSLETAFPGKDSLITDEPGILLTAFFADCVPLFFVDPKTGAIGLAHAGWRGTTAEIARTTVEAMSRHYGSRPENLRAAIGPSIGPCCYEVDEPVVERVRPLAEPDTGVVRETKSGKYRLNLQELNRQIMIKAGILPTRIEITSWCTSCHTEWFYSHRREQGRTGRMAAWIGWKR
jgi:hypothetical protein